MVGALQASLPSIQQIVLAVASLLPALAPLLPLWAQWLTAILPVVAPIAQLAALLVGYLVPPLRLLITIAVRIVEWPVTFPISWATTTSTGAAQFSNAGGVPSHFTARLYGPCTAPRLVNETTGETIIFTSGLVLGPGEYVEINTRDRSADLLSNTSQSRLNMIDFAVTSWWRIEAQPREGGAFRRVRHAAISPWASRPRSCNRRCGIPGAGRAGSSGVRAGSVRSSAPRCPDSVI